MPGMDAVRVQENLSYVNQGIVRMMVLGSE